MPRFRYSAIGQDGATQPGVIEAPDERAAVLALREQGKLPVRVEPDAPKGAIGRLLAAEFAWRRGLGAADVAEAIHELATMLAAGQDLDRALRYIADTAPRRATRACFTDLRQSVRNGASLATALERHRASFTPLSIAVVRAGEAGGRIAEALERLAVMLERERAMAQAIQSAMIYPVLLLVAAIGAIAVILTQVLPQFVPLFAEAGSALPPSTRVLLAAGDFVGAYGMLLLLALLGLVALVQAARRNEGVATQIDRLRLNMPIFGVVHREILAGRFTRTLGTLLANGVPLIAALRITGPVLQNRVALHMVEEATEASTRGAGLSGTIAASGIFPLRTGQLLRLGEENGELGAMALRAADIHEERARQMMQRRLAMLVPGITILLGGVIAGIVATLLTAMLSLNDLVG